MAHLLGSGNRAATSVCGENGGNGMCKQYDNVAVLAVAYGVPVKMSCIISKRNVAAYVPA